MKVIYNVLTAVLICMISVNCFGQQSDRQYQRRTEEGYHARLDYERRVNQNQSISTLETGFYTLVFIGLGAAAIENSRNYSSGYSRSRSQFTRWKPRAPGLLLGGSFVGYKTPISEDLTTGFSTEFKGDMLLFGTSGRYPNFGLYANASISSYRYKLPHTYHTYWLGSTYVADSDPSLIYRLPTSRANDEDERKISLSERSINVGLTLKTVIAHGYFLDLGIGMKVSRLLSLRFNEGEGYRYLGGEHRIRDYKIKNVYKPAKAAFLFGLPNTYAEVGIGKIFQGQRAPHHLRVVGKLYQNDIHDFDGNKQLEIYRGEPSQQVPISLNMRENLAYSISLEYAFVFGRFYK